MPASHAQTLIALACLAAGAAAHAAPNCYANYGAIGSNKPNKLFLYFPTSDDPMFPNFGALTQPARTFDIATLPNGPAGTTAQLRDRIYDVVATAYCEFNVEVMPPTTTNPDALVAPPARRNMVAIGSDANGDASGVLFGLAEAVDTGDADVVDHSRVWAGSYGVFCGAPGRPLDGAGNTLDHWAMGIGGTAAHEAGHNYGLAHSTTLHLGEDPITNHLMPAGGNIPCGDRVNHLRHFSDQDFGILANNVGLTLQSLANWDFVNPNAATASALRMTVLSLSPTLTQASAYLGTRSPWGEPVITHAGTATFKGQLFNRYHVTWNVANPNGFIGAVNGQVQGGEEFHVGANFNEANVGTATTNVVIADAVLLNAAGGELPLHPRVPSFDTGTLNADGSYFVNFLNLQAVNLVLRNAQAFVLPRPLHIDALALGAAGKMEFFDVTGERVTPWRQVQLPAALELPAGHPDQPAVARLPLGNLFKDGHNVRIKTNRETGDAFGVAEVNRAPTGRWLSDPFPGASVVIAGELVDPSAVQWDPQQKAYVQKELVTRVFVQVAGQRAKPVDGQVAGLLRSKITCANLNSRASIGAAADANGRFDCETSGLVSRHGDRVQLTQVGIAGNPQPLVAVAGLDIAKAVCTNLNTRQTLSFKPEPNAPALDCAKAGLKVETGNVLEVSQIGTVR